MNIRPKRTSLHTAAQVTKNPIVVKPITCEGDDCQVQPVPINRMVKSGMVKVRCRGHICEGGRCYKPGECFTCTTERFAALGRQVECVGDDCKP